MPYHAMQEPDMEVEAPAPAKRGRKPKQAEPVQVSRGDWPAALHANICRICILCYI